jgi:hypothetical protein
MKQQGEMDDPNSPASVVRAALLKKYMPDINAGGLPATQLDPLLAISEKGYQIDENNQAKKEIAAQRAEDLKNNKEIMLGTKESQWQEGQWAKLTDKINGINAGSRRALGVAASNNMRADRLLQTALNPYSTSQDIANIVSDIQAIYKGGVPDEVSMQHGDYNTFQRKLSEVMTYISSKPQNAHNPEVVKRLKDIALELKDVDNKVIHDNMGIHAIAFKKLIATDPDRWQALQDSVMKTTENPGEGDSASYLPPDKAKRLQELRAKAGN